MILNWGVELADREELSVFAWVSPMIMSFKETGHLGFEIANSWITDTKGSAGEIKYDSKWH
jgi:hypothetical protein